MPGQFVRLADGVTHYEPAGPDSGQVVLLAAAFSVPAYLSDSLFQRLGRSGFRVIRFDYYGRGWSDRPMTTYDLDLFGRQMNELLDSLGIPGAVDVAGLSFGAAIVTNFADRYPDRVRSLIYIDPVFNTGRQLPPRERTAWAWDIYMVFREGPTTWPGASSTISFTRSGFRTGWIATGCSSNSRVPARRSGERGWRSPWRRIRQSRFSGWARIPGGCCSSGRQDTGASIGESEGLLAAMPRAEFVPVDSAGHLPHLEQPDIVVPTVVQFLVATRPPSP